jgi:flagellar biosynthesis protein FlhF
MMKIKKFTAASIPEALGLVKAEMGEDALILGTSRSRAGKGRTGRVEVVAALDGRRTAKRKEKGARVAVAGPEIPVDMKSVPTAVEGSAPGTPGTKQGPGQSRRRKGKDRQAGGIKDMRNLDKDIVGELKRIEARLKEVLEGYDAARPPVDRPAPALNRDVVNAGFDPALLEGKVPTSLLRSDAAPDRIVRALVGSVDVAPSEDRILVFLGPSGAGKTTSLLKVARSVFLAGGVKPRVVAFGAREEDSIRLKTECRHLGLQFSRISRADKMAKVLKNEKAPLLIDTPGISNLDEKDLRFLVEAAKATPGMGLKLVVEATMDPWNVCAIASCVPEGSRMSLVLTKLDEATRIGGAVSAAIAGGIPVAFVTGGRRPADGVHVPDVDLLSEKILDGVKSARVEIPGRRD